MSNFSFNYQRMLELLHLRSVDDLKSRTQQLTQSLGFDYFMYGKSSSATACGVASEVLLLGTYPQNWLTRYAE